jgi:hypothetical protein
MSSFPLWQVSPAQSQRITGARIFLGVIAGFFFLPSFFVIVATLMNLMIGSGYDVPNPIRYGFYLASQALPYGLIAVVSAVPFCFAARRSGHIGLGPLLILALSIFLLLSTALWVSQLVSFNLSAFLLLALISQIYGLALWLILRVVCITGFKPYQPRR